MATKTEGKKNAERKAPIACCPRDGAPLVSTMAFSKAEFYCLDCGSHLGFLDPRRGDPEDAGLVTRMEAYEAEWKDNAGGKLLTAGGYHRDCDKCWKEPRTDGGTPSGMLEPHTQHATPEEWEAHEEALTWLKQRVR